MVIVGKLVVARRVSSGLCGPSLVTSRFIERDDRCVSKNSLIVRRGFLDLLRTPRHRVVGPAFYELVRN